MGALDYSSMTESGTYQLLAFAKSVDPSAIESVANAWRKLVEDIPEAYQSFKNSLNGVFGAEWTGDAAESARAASDRLCSGMNTNIERISAMHGKLQGLSSAAHQVKSVADWAEEAMNSNSKNLSTQEFQEIGQALASSLQAFYGAHGQDPLGSLEPFQQVAPLVFANPDAIFNESAGGKTQRESGSEDSLGGETREKQGAGQGAGSGSPSGGEGAGQGSGGGSPSGSGSGGSPSGAGAGLGSGSSLEAPGLGSTDLMSSDLAPMDPAAAAGGGIGGMGGDHERKLSAAPGKVDASNKPVVNVNTPGAGATTGQQAMGGGMGGGMGHGGGGEGKEYKTPDYLINNDNGHDLVGFVLPVVSPEVIGELDKGEVKRMEAAQAKIAPAPEKA